MRTLWRIGLGLLAAGALASGALYGSLKVGAPAVAVGECAPIDPTFAAWDSLLRRTVVAGQVDYAALRGPLRPELDAVTTSFEAACKPELDAAARELQLAWWINVYNVYMIQRVVTEGPIQSVHDLGALPGAVFAQTFVPLRARSDSAMSLNEVEHAVLRAELKEPRIHFAIVCASASCPNLRGEAWVPVGLDAQLNAGATLFMADPSKNRLEGGKLQLSRIFDWFGSDFVGEGGRIQDAIADWSPDPAAWRAAELGPYLPYDWALNAQAGKQ